MVGLSVSNNIDITGRKPNLIGEEKIVLLINLDGLLIEDKAILL